MKGRTLGHSGQGRSPTGPGGGGSLVSEWGRFNARDILSGHVRGEKGGTHIFLKKKTKLADCDWLRRFFFTFYRLTCPTMK